MKVATAIKVMKIMKVMKALNATAVMKVAKAKHSAETHGGEVVVKRPGGKTTSTKSKTVYMDDVWKKLKDEGKDLSVGAFTSRAYDRAVYRARSAGMTNEAAREFGRKMYAKASAMYTQMAGK